MSLEWIKYRDHKVLYANYQLLSPKDIIEQIYEASRICANSEEKILVLSNFEGVPMSKRIVEETKHLGKTIFSKKTEKSAVIGVTGIKKLLLKIYCQFSDDAVVPFSTKEEALGYLTSVPSKNELLETKLHSIARPTSIEL